MPTSRSHDKPILLDLRLFAGLSLGLVALRFGPLAGMVVLLSLAVYALLGVRQAVVSLMAASVIAVINPSLFPVKGAIVSLLRWGVILAAAVTVVRTARSTARPTTLRAVVYLVVFIAYTFAVANVVGYAPAVSNLKLTIFAIGSLTICHLFIFAHDRSSLQQSIFTFVAFFALSSLAIWVLFPQEAYKRGYGEAAWGLQGVTNQGQVLGMTCALMITWMVDKLVRLSKYRNVWVAVLILVLLALLFQSRARIGLVALALAGGTTTLLVLVSARWRRRYVYAFKLKHLGYAVVTAALVAASALTVFREPVTSFVFKNGRNSQDLAVSFYESRGFRIVELYESWQRNPTFGLGFGLATNPRTLDVVYDPVLNAIPVSASTEKNFLPFALLEETGWVGGFLFLAFLVSVTVFFFTYSHPTTFVIFLTGIYINVGEAVFFSLGGGGLVVFVLMMSGLQSATAATGLARATPDALP